MNKLIAIKLCAPSLEKCKINTGVNTIPNLCQGRSNALSNVLPASGNMLTAIVISAASIEVLIHHASWVQKSWTCEGNWIELEYCSFNVQITLKSGESTFPNISTIRRGSMDDDAQTSSILGLRGFISSNFGEHKSLLIFGCQGVFLRCNFWVHGLRV